MGSLERYVGNPTLLRILRIFPHKVSIYVGLLTYAYCTIKTEICAAWPYRLTMKSLGVEDYSYDSMGFFYGDIYRAYTFWK